MDTVGIVIAAIFAAAIISTKLLRRHRVSPRAVPVLGALAACLAVAVSAVGGGAARAAIVPTIPLATAANYSVLAGTTVFNTGPTQLALNAGVSPGSAIDGFPPGATLGIIDDGGTATSLQAQNELTAAYTEAANRPINATTTGALGGLTLVGGVYNGTANGPLTLTGPLVLDGQGDPNSVFIFQTGSTLITDSGSTVSLINGAQECNVFWQVGSSATLGTGSTFAGNILALTTITVTTGVTVHGRALARNAAVTLDNDVFTAPTCDLSPIPTTVPVTAAAAVPGGGGGTGGAETTDVTGAGATTPGGVGATTPGGAGATVPGTPVLILPETGTSNLTIALLAGAMIALGVTVVRTARRPPAR